MEPDRLEFFRRLLTERKQALLREAGQNLEGLIEDREAIADTIDIAAEETDREFALRLQDRDRKLLHKIDEAINRAADGTYGVCIACGEDIDERRLMARPVATHCIDCKTEAEQLEVRRRAF